MREQILAYADDAQINICEQVKIGTQIKRLPVGFVSVARALELVDEGQVGGISTRTSLRYLLAHSGVEVDLRLKAKQHKERAGDDLVAEDSRTVFSGAGDLALNYSYDFKVAGAYQPAARLMTSGKRQTVMLERGRDLREAMDIGAGIS